MNLAIIHYHLNRGGVTQVILNHLRAIRAARSPGHDFQVTVLFGGRREGWPAGIAGELDAMRLQLVPVPGLEYDTGGAPQPARLAADLAAALREADATPADTVVHIHNHSLGKNSALPGALAQLADDGYRLLLQIHDFAEDFRPENYRRLETALGGDNRSELPGRLYPQADHIHYATLNRRDFDVLSTAGVPAGRLHLLPNPVFDLGALPDRSESRQKLARRFGVPHNARLLLYPVRGIRRKNVGEALLWSVLAGGDAHVGVTLEPLNPSERTHYQRWCELSDELQLPCQFGLGEADGLSFSENLACADAILTTSVAEGFGMVFAEAWLAGRPLVGRDLPDITRDFTDAGMRLDTLRPRLDVPLDLVGSDAVRQSFLAAYAEVLAAYRRDLPDADQASRAISTILAGNKVDFASLTSKLQGRVIRLARTQTDSCRRLKSINPWFDDVVRLSPDNAAEMVRHNARVVRTAYSLEACGRRLIQLYEVVAGSGRGARQPLPHREAILDSFLDITRFCPVRTEA